MSKYFVLCDVVNKFDATSERGAHRIYSNAIRSGKYSSVVLRKEERSHGYAIKSWSKDGGEVLML